MFEPLRRVFAHEELFVDRYDHLLRTALRVTEGDRQAAEDLVQDAYIRFTLVQPPLDDVARLDAYFYVMLRNMYTSRVRRRGRASEVSLSILDFDSLALGLKALDWPSREEARQSLYAACEYGCRRRHSSKTGSLFLLRFFHGYLPSEIATIAGLTAAMVDDQVYRARREAELFVNHPGQLAFFESAGTPGPAVPSPATCEGDNGSEEALVESLRARIFSERHEPCRSKRTLRELYGRGRTEPLTREQLATLVCCPACLDEINTILNIPRLASRWPTDTPGPGTRGSAGRDRPSSLATARQRKRAIFEHRPHELRVLVNGFELGSHTLGSPRSELVLTANIGERVALLEVFSEQDLCLLFLDVCPPPEGPVRQRRVVELSDGRRAELEVTFGGAWPTITTTYDDPRVSTPAATASEPADDAPSIRQAHVVPSKTNRWSRLFGLRPSPAMIVVGALLLWLMFWTPGMQVSAATRIADTVKWLVGELLGSPKTSRLPARGPEVRPAPIAPETPAPVARPAASATAPRLTAARRTALELRALLQLQQVNAYLGQEVSFTAVPGARVELRAVVQDKERKDTLLRALASVARTRDVRVAIEDLQEVSKRVRPLVGEAGSASQQAVLTRDQFPMFEPLQQYFRHQQEYERHDRSVDVPANDTQIEARVRRFAVQLLDHSRRASQHAWALKHLSDRFPPATIRAASAETQELWQVVLREHGQGYRQELALLRAALEPVVQESSLVESGLPDTVPASKLTDSWTRIARLLELQKTQDAAIRAAFAVRSESGGGSLVQTRAFWRLLDEADALAGDVATPPSR